MPQIATLRGLTRIWTFRPEADADLPLAARVLAARGLVDGAEVEAFLNPSLKMLHDPSLIPDLDKAAGRILEALEAKQRIVIYGDYDVDGITATTILYKTFKLLRPDADLISYIPHRVDEGYGLNSEAIERLAADGAKVIVTVDCGVTAIEQAEVAKRLGVDLIITDHHNPPRSCEDLPAAFAVVHPRHPESTYPYGELCGAGVAYKLAWRLGTLAAGSDRVGAAMQKLLIDLLAMVALGTIADVVPLTGENRVLARFGLARIKHSPIVGLRALVNASGLAGDNIAEEDAGFRLAPRLNACGRMGHARDAVELFSTEDAKRASQIADDLTRLNDKRRVEEQQIVQTAIELAQERGMTEPDRRAIVLAHRDWHPGIVGIACSRLVERFARPVVLMQDCGDVCKGSGRSVDGYSLHAGLEACSDLIEKFGGHDMAAGLTIRTANLDAMTEALINHANAHIGPEDLVHSVEIDVDASIDELTAAVVGELDRLAPFGRENARLKVRLRDVRIIGRPEFLGRSGKHLALRIGNSSRSLRCVAWGWGEHIERIGTGAAVEAVICPKVSKWGGRVNVEPELIDLRVVE